MNIGSHDSPSHKITKVMDQVRAHLDYAMQTVNMMPHFVYTYQYMIANSVTITLAAFISQKITWYKF